MGPQILFILSVAILLVILILIMNITFGKRERRNVAKIKEQYDIVCSLSRDYLNVFYIDSVKKTAEIFKLDGYVTAGMDNKVGSIFDYDTLYKKYVEDRVAPVDKEMMLKALSLESVVTATEKQEEYLGTYRVLDKDEIHYYQYKYIKMSEDKYIAGFNNIDIVVNEQKAQKEELEKALEAAERANIAKSTFLFNISHDVRTPMNAILGYTELLKKKGDDKAKRDSYINNILISANYLLDLLNNVLDMSRIESGKLEVVEALGDTYEVGTAFEYAFEHTLKEKDLVMELHDNTTHRYVYHDRIKMEQVMMNIVSNSVKYTPSGGRIDIYFSEEPTETEGVSIFTSVVKDTGIGISKEFLPHVFDQFSREKTTTENKINGTGLGLGIVKRLVELMNGTISIESEVGKGTTVTVSVPHRFEEDMQKINNANLGKADYSLAGRRILLAEDNELNAEIACEMLSDMGAEIEVAEDGIICLDMLKKHEAGYYDFILMDIQMPNMDGYKTTTEIRKLSDEKLAHIPIIAMTANAFNRDRQKAFSVGINGFVSKPVDVSKLIEELTKVIAGA